MSSSPSSPVLSIRKLTIPLPRGGDRPYAVEGLSLDVLPNEIVCIVGESGSGKSITSFATMGLLPKTLQASSGQIMFGGQDMTRISEAEHARLRGSRMAMIFQEPMTALNPCYTVGDQIEEVYATHTGISRLERRTRTLALLEEVKLADSRRIYNSFPHQLSGGQRQRIVIAIALALGPKLLIADEPTTALDVTTQAQILKMFKELRQARDAGIMFVTHDFGVVFEIADKVVVMRGGRVVEQGPAAEIMNRPTHPYTRLLIDAVPRRAPALAVPQETRPLAMRVVGIEKTFNIARTLFKPARAVNALKPVDFTMQVGETLGIVGESGSGKTTLVRCLVRLLDPDAGAVWVGSTDLAAQERHRLRLHRKDIQIVFQDPYGSLNPRRRIGDQLIEGPLNFGEPRAAAITKARELMRIVRMDEDALDRYPVKFSGGQRQRICIARALMVGPKILIADEAVSALDVSVQKEVLALLADIKERLGLTLLFITHDLRVAAQICDNILVMSQGEVVERGTINDVFGAPKHPYTRQLLEAMPGRDWEIPDVSRLDASLGV